MATVKAEDIERLTRHLWHTSQHDRMIIGLSGRIQDVADELRQLAGLEPMLDSIPDREVGECSVHVNNCQGQETHSLAGECERARDRVEQVPAHARPVYVKPPATKKSESTYTLNEARRELDYRECSAHGHDWEIITAVASDNGRPIALVCGRCGMRYSVVDNAEQTSR